MRTRAFVDKSVPDVLRQVLQEYGLAGEEDARFLWTRPYAPNAHILQYQESDLAFLSRLLEHEGIFFYFQQSREGRDQIVVGDSPTAYDISFLGPRAPVAYEPQAEAHGGSALGSADLSEWWNDPKIFKLGCRQSLLPATSVIRDFDPNRFLMEAEHPLGPGSGTYSEYGNSVQTDEGARTLARIRAEEIGCRRRLFFGSGNDRTFRPGTKFALRGHYVAHYNTELLITEVNHSWSQEIGEGDPPAV